jgi:hypothetical protein
MARDGFGCWISGLLMMAGPVLAEPPPAPIDPYRQAILIGVWDYDHENDLGSMDSDLQALSTTFAQLNFDRVVALPNPSQQEIVAAISDAVQTAKGVGNDRGVLTVVYFGGHGTMVDNSSYLLARDFVRTANGSEIIISGGIRTDYIGEQISRAGQPALLIVEACRNPYVPGAAASPVAADEANDSDTDDDGNEEVNPPMIELPGMHPGYITLFGQTPGKLVEIAPRADGQPTVLVQAMRDYAPRFGSLPALGSVIRNHVLNATLGQRHPMEPHLDARGGGELHLFYNDNDRAADRLQWEALSAPGDAGLVRMFLAAYPTSPNVPVAKWWLRQYEALTLQPREFVAYTPSHSAILGRRSPIFGNMRQVRIAANVHTDVGKIQSERIEALQRLPGPDQEYQGRTVDGHAFRISGQLPRQYDVSRVSAFWSDQQVTAVDCRVPQIEAGNCPSIEQIAELTRRRTPEQVGTLYIAVVLDPDRPAADTLAEALAIHARLKALGVPKNAVSFRHFYKAELDVAATQILVKRGDGNLLDNLE